ncbi:MAG: T9SS type A sorting domain-containing protein [Candidatus Zixiibacteriota bacterium]|nr:MAG: T9SS type A sorting domain-containing protein [candidate division Zixibacteria bacterium]
MIYYRILFSLIIIVELSSTALGQAPDTLWIKTYDFEDRVEQCWKAIATPDGGLAITGATTYGGYSTTPYLLRINANGDTLWSRRPNFWGIGRAICMSPDNGFIIAGSHNESPHQFPFILKLDCSGNTIWSNFLYDLGHGVLRSVQPVGLDGYILTGYKLGTFPDYADSVLLFRINSGGDYLWSRVYSGANDERAWSVVPTSDSGFIIVGWTESSGNGLSDFYIIKTDSNGDSIWTKTFGSPWEDEGRDILETPDGGYVFSGKRSISQSKANHYLMKINSQGDSIWAHSYVDVISYTITHSITQTLDGGYALIGYRPYSSNIRYIDIIRTDAQGDSLWSKRFWHNPVKYYGRSIIQAQDGSYFLCGNNVEDIWVVKLAPEITNIENGNNLFPNIFILHQNHPNPFNAATAIRYSLPYESEIRLSIYNILGRKIEILFEGTQNPGEHIITWDASHLPSGIYFARLETRCRTENIKMVLLK